MSPLLALMGKKKKKRAAPPPDTAAAPWIAAGLLVAIAYVAVRTAGDHRLAAWLLTLILMAALLFAATQTPLRARFAIFVDRRNRMSLSRVQFAAWIILLLSALFTAVTVNLHAGAPDPFAIEFPRALWILLAIAAISLVGSPMLLAPKARQRAARKELARESSRVRRLDGVELAHEGQLARKRKPAHARWSDLFRGEETGNASYLDVARIQLFTVTVILFVLYGLALARLFDEPAETGAAIAALPAPHAGVLALFGLSHTLYLANKLVAHSKPVA